jgi:glyoxylase-like metal-dependent hydrolase (beta-lactamase superfamily II)
LHKNDFPLWRLQGGAPYFGLKFESGPDPTIELFEGEKISVGEYNFEVRCAPGHTPGHVIFYCKREAVAFCGDVIFWGSIGRTDLPGGNYQTLLHSIQTQILTMPNETCLYTGHGPATTVGRERDTNPFLG